MLGESIFLCAVLLYSGRVMATLPSVPELGVFTFFHVSARGRIACGKGVFVHSRGANGMVSVLGTYTELVSTIKWEIFETDTHTCRETEGNILVSVNTSVHLGIW